MKQTLIALLALVLLASCEQKVAGEATNPASEKGGHAGRGMSIKTVEGEEGNGDPNDYHNFTMSRNYADSLIQHYHRIVMAQLGPGQIGKDSFKKHTENLSFMINAEMLRNYLNQNPNIKKLDVYLAAQLNNNKMKLVFIGAEDSLDAAGNPVLEHGEPIYVERLIHKDNDPDNYVLDHVDPCPNCENRIAELGGWDN